jgi:hypothetical protein
MVRSLLQLSILASYLCAALLAQSTPLPGECVDPRTHGGGRIRTMAEVTAVQRVLDSLMPQDRAFVRSIEAPWEAPAGEAAPAPPTPHATSTGATAPHLLRGFAGPKLFDTGGGFIPPDSCGAVGIDHFVSIVNSNLSVFEKATGRRVVDVSLAAFFAAPAPRVLGDPRAVFDPDSRRFFVSASSGPAGFIHIGVSLTSDPTGAWYVDSILASQGADANRWPDFPTLGVDKRGVYLAALMVDHSGPMTIWAIDKAPLTAAVPSLGTVTAWRNLSWEGAIQPCVTFGDPGAEILVSRYDPVTLRLREVRGPLTAPTLVQLGLVTVPSHVSPPRAPALGSATPLAAGDFRPRNAIFRNGRVWIAQTVMVAQRAACRWYEIDPRASTTIQFGTVADPVRHYFYPSIAVNDRGDAILAFSGSHAGEYAGAFYTGRLASDPPGEMAPPALLKAGEGPYERLDNGTNRYGDYSMSSADPADDSLWTIQEYAKAGNLWGTWIGRLRFDWFAYGQGLAGTLGVPVLTLFGEPVIGTTPTLFFGNSRGASTPGVLAVGVARASLPLLGGTLLVQPVLTPGYQVAPTGAFTALPLPNDPQLVGQSVFAQAVQVDPGAVAGVAFTRGLELRLGRR